jgi:phosphate transport system substrate-binding protein
MRALLAFVAAFFVASLLTSLSFAATTIRVHGTTNLAPMVTKAATAYQSNHPDTAIDVQGTSSGEGIASLKSHDADVAMSDVAVSDPDFVDTTLGVVGFAFVVGSKAGVSNLTRAEVQKMYAGKVTNWKQVGGNDEKIILIGRQIGTGTRLVMEQKVAKTLVPTQIQPNAKAVVDAVAATPGAIGYIATAFIGDNQNLVVTYQNVAPTEANIRSHTYAFSTDEHLYTLKTASPDVTAFVQYVKGDTALLEANGVY